LPEKAILVLCEPEQLAARAEDYAKQVLKNDPFFIAWEEFQQLAVAKGLTTLKVSEVEADASDLNKEAGDAVALDAHFPLTPVLPINLKLKEGPLTRRREDAMSGQAPSLSPSEGERVLEGRVRGFGVQSTALRTS